MTRAAAAWERFWFEPEPAATLALLRIAIACVTLMWALASLPDLETFEGPRGIVPGSASAVPVYVCLIVAAIGLALGYRSRLCAAAAFACLAWFHHVDPWALNSGDALLRDMLFLLALAPAGAYFSVDAVRGRRRRGAAPAHVSRWSVRLVQAQVSAMYLAAVAQKLAGAPWRDGTAVSYPLRIPTMTRVSLPHWVTVAPLTVHALTWGVLVTELAIGVLVWIRRTRPWVLAAGIVLHVTIDITLRAGFFSWIVLATYVAFVPAHHADRIIRAIQTRARAIQELRARHGRDSVLVPSRRRV